MKGQTPSPSRSSTATPSPRSRRRSSTRCTARSRAPAGPRRTVWSSVSAGPLCPAGRAGGGRRREPCQALCGRVPGARPCRPAEWRPGSTAQILSDLDLTSQREGRWRRINTLMHYNVSAGGRGPGSPWAEGRGVRPALTARLCPQVRDGATLILSKVGVSQQPEDSQQDLPGERESFLSPVVSGPSAWTSVHLQVPSGGRRSSADPRCAPPHRPRPSGGREPRVAPGAAGGRGGGGQVQARQHEGEGAHQGHHGDLPDPPALGQGGRRAGGGRAVGGPGAGSGRAER